MLDEAVSLSHSGHLLLLGDFNYPHVDYNNFEVLGPVESDAHTKFFEKSQDFYLCHCLSIENCTHFREGHSRSKLICIFTNEENQIDSLCYDVPLGKSDHCFLSFVLVLQSTLHVTI